MIIIIERNDIYKSENKKAPSDEGAVSEADWGRDIYNFYSIPRLFFL